MNRKIFLFVTACVFLVGGIGAQETQRGPDGGTTYHVSGVDLLAIPGKPFSARTSTEWTRTLEDGSTVKLHLEANLARDGQGRMYRERRSFVPEGSNQRSVLKEILLYDPLQRTLTTCVIKARICSITTYHPQLTFTTIPAGPFAQGTRYLTRENLGTNTIDGLDVTGTRETITINPGVVGNQKPLVSTREFWYSADLETNLAVTRNDPREGMQVIQLSYISRYEPEPEKLQVPAGFTVKDDRTTTGAPAASPQN